MELTPNCVYKVNHSSGMIAWKYLRKEVCAPFGGSLWYEARKTKRYYGINLKTGREVVLKSTAKICCELESPHGTEAGRGNYL